MNIKVLKNILQANDQVAADIRQQLAQRHITAINVISSPGAGKTSLLERTIPLLQPHYRLGVLEGDIATTRDAERVGKLGVPVIQLITGGACHLEAALVQRGLGELGPDNLELLIIENVGNIACPAEFDLGENAKIGVLSVAEGHDKPAKYPLLFHEVSALVLNKIDLLPYTDFDYAKFEADFRKLNARAPIFKLSCRTGEGLDAWIHWLEHVIAGEIHVHAHTHGPALDGLQPVSPGLEGIMPHTHPHKK